MKKGKQFDTMFRDFSMLDVSNILFEPHQEFAINMDEHDPLARFQNEFYFPEDKNGDKLIYLCGNSLGLQSKGAETMVIQAMQQWKHLGVKGHFNGERPWVPFHLSLKKSMANLVGAKPEEVTLMNTLTVNLHLMLTSFYRPHGNRTKILIEPDIFPSDKYAIESQIEWHGLQIKDELMVIKKPSHDENIRLEDIQNILEERGEEIALIILGGVNYYTGQLLNIPKITKMGHEKGCVVGFDLAHAAGNVPLSLHDDGVDFAVWCTYKYMNAGPGSIAGAFVHEKHGQDASLPKLKGWWGHKAEIRFGMRDEFEAMPGVESWQISCQPILSLVPIKASLDLFEEAGMKALRNKSILLTGYLEYLLKQLNNKRIEIITPRLQEERGCQLSILIKDGDKSIYESLMNAGVVVDWREPNVVRVAPTPLYNRYEDAWTFVKILSSIIS